MQCSRRCRCAPRLAARTTARRCCSASRRCAWRLRRRRCVALLPAAHDPSAADPTLCCSLATLLTAAPGAPAPAARCRSRRRSCASPPGTRRAKALSPRLGAKTCQRTTAAGAPPAPCPACALPLPTPHACRRRSSSAPRHRRRWLPPSDAGKGRHRARVSTSSQEPRRSCCAAARRSVLLLRMLSNRQRVARPPVCPCWWCAHVFLDDWIGAVELVFKPSSRMAPAPTTKPRVVILGGGLGGAEVAHDRKLLKVRPVDRCMAAQHASASAAALRAQRPYACARHRTWRDVGCACTRCTRVQSLLAVALTNHPALSAPRRLRTSPSSTTKTILRYDGTAAPRLRLLHGRVAPLSLWHLGGALGRQKLATRAMRVLPVPAPCVGC